MRIYPWRVRISRSGPARAAQSAALLALATGAVALGAGAGGLPAARAQSAADCGGPYSGVTGQPVIMTASVPVHGVVVYSWDYGDDASGYHNPTQHVYSTPGTYQVSLHAVSSTLDDADCTTSVTIAGAAVAPVVTHTSGAIAVPGSSAAPASGAAVTYAAGWNLVAGPDGTTFPQASNSLYTLQANDTAYEQLSPSAGVTSGYGYWAYFNGPTTFVPIGPGTSGAQLMAPAGQWILVGNPSASATVTVRGADAVLRYDPVSGSYLSATTLGPGQAAWAISNAGGTIAVGP